MNTHTTPVFLFLAFGSHLPSPFYRWACCKDSGAGLESVWCDQSVPCSLSQVLLWRLARLWRPMLHPCSCSQAALHHGGGLQGAHAKCVSLHIYWCCSHCKWFNMCPYFYCMNGQQWHSHLDRKLRRGDKFTDLQFLRSPIFKQKPGRKSVQKSRNSLSSQQPFEKYNESFVGCRWEQLPCLSSLNSWLLAAIVSFNVISFVSWQVIILFSTVKAVLWSVLHVIFVTFFTAYFAEI